MVRRFFSFFQYVFFFGLGIFLVWWQFDQMTAIQRIQFKDSLRNADYWLLFPVVIMCILSHISRAVRWKLLMEPMGYKPSTANAFYSVMTGYVANTFVPRAGEVIKCTMLGRYEKIPVNKLLGTILVERAFDFLCYLIFILITIFIQLGLLSDFVKEKIAKLNDSNAAIPAWIKLLVFVIIVILFILTLRWSFKRYAEKKIIKKIRGFTSGLREGFTTIAHLKKRGWFIAHTFFIWTMYLMQIYIGFSALSATAHLHIKEACSVLSLATLGMIVSPGGIGAFPLAVQEVLLLYKVDNVSFGWLIWGVSTAITLVGGTVSFILLITKNRKYNEVKPQPAEQDLYAGRNDQGSKTLEADQ